MSRQHLSVEYGSHAKLSPLVAPTGAQHSPFHRSAGQAGIHLLLEQQENDQRGNQRQQHACADDIVGALEGAGEGIQRRGNRPNHNIEM